MLRTHAQTSGVSLTAQQPEINIVRVALQALAGVLGGVIAAIAAGHRHSIWSVMVLSGRWSFVLRPSSSLTQRS
jgi:hypothetical protein